MHPELLYLRSNLLRSFGVRLLTHWPFLTGEKRGVVAPIHVSHAYIVTISPVQIPGDQKTSSNYLRWAITFSLRYTCLPQAEEWTHPRIGCNTREWGLSNPWMTAFLKDPSSLATLICFLLAS